MGMILVPLDTVALIEATWHHNCSFSILTAPNSVSTTSNTFPTRFFAARESLRSTSNTRSLASFTFLGGPEGIFLALLLLLHLRTNLALSKNARGTSTPPTLALWNVACSFASSVFDGIYSIPHTLQLRCGLPPRSIVICVRRGCFLLVGLEEALRTLGEVCCSGAESRLICTKLLFRE